MKKLIALTIAIMLAMPTKMVPGTIYGARHHFCLRPMAEKHKEKMRIFNIPEFTVDELESFRNDLAELEEGFPESFRQDADSLLKDIRSRTRGVILGVLNENGQLIAYTIASALSENKKYYEIETKIMQALGVHDKDIEQRLAKTWFINRIVVMPQHRDASIARQLFTKLYTRLQPENCSFLSALVVNKGLAKYLKSQGAEEAYKQEDGSYLRFPREPSDKITEKSKLQEWIEAQGLNIGDAQVIYALEHGFSMPKVKRGLDPGKIDAGDKVNIGIVGFNNWYSEDNLTTLRASERFPRANAVFVNSKDDIMINERNGLRLVQIKRGFMFLDGELTFVEFSRPLTLHYIINFSINEETKEKLIASGIPMMGGPIISAVTEDKLISGEALRAAGVRTPEEPDYNEWHTEGWGSDLNTLLNEFMKSKSIRQLTAKRRYGSSGEGILYIDSKEDMQWQVCASFKDSWPTLLFYIVIQERIFPKKIRVVVGGEERELDWNLRVFVTKRPDRSLSIRMLVRYGEGVVNICQGAEVMDIDTLSQKLGLDAENKDIFLRRVKEIAKKTFLAMEAYVYDLREAALRKEITDNPICRSTLRSSEHGPDIFFRVDKDLDEIKLMGWVRPGPLKPTGSNVLCVDEKLIERVKDKDGNVNLNDASELMYYKRYDKDEDDYIVLVNVSFGYGFYPFIRWITVHYKGESVEIRKDASGKIRPVALLRKHATLSGFPLDEHQLKIIYDLAIAKVREIYKQGDKFIAGTERIFQCPVDMSNEGPFRTDSLGLDIICDGQAIVPNIMEVNDHHAGGMWDLNQVVGTDRQDEIVIPMYEIALSRGNEYKRKQNEKGRGRPKQKGPSIIEPISPKTALAIAGAA